MSKFIKNANLRFFLTTTLLGFSSAPGLAQVDETKHTITFTTIEKKDPKTNKLMKVWVPGSVKIKSDQKYQIHLINKLKVPHGFEVPGLVSATVVLPTTDKTKVQTVALMVKKPGSYDARCHLHPAHVSAKIIVQ